MIVVITGDLGTGKTAMLTRYGCKSSVHKENVLANYKLSHVQFEPFDMVDLYLNQPELTNAIILGDELYTFMDCRSSMSIRNKLESYFITQTRKKNVDIYFTTQFSEFVDFRMILFASIWVKMSNIWLYSSKTGQRYKHPYLFNVVFHDYRDKDNIKVKYMRFDGRRWFGEYNTNETIYPPDDIKETIKRFKERNKQRGKRAE